MYLCTPEMFFKTSQFNCENNPSPGQYLNRWPASESFAHVGPYQLLTIGPGHHNICCLYARRCLHSYTCIFVPVSMAWDIKKKLERKYRVTLYLSLTIFFYTFSRFWFCSVPEWWRDGSNSLWVSNVHGKKKILISSQVHRQESSLFQNRISLSSNGRDIKSEILTNPCSKGNPHTDLREYHSEDLRSSVVNSTIFAVFYCVKETLFRGLTVQTLTKIHFSLLLLKG